MNNEKVEKRDYVTVSKECGGMVSERRIPITLLKYAEFDIIQAEEDRAERELFSNRAKEALK